ncbi:MAG TPA: radical SAM protein [Desulfatiglandales bacterium]|nr:radical SAM protein [Desulfatiglandales bacterium]
MGNSCIPEIDIASYWQRLINNEGAQRIPLSGTVELTFRCNNRCVHCYVNKRIDAPGEKERELSCTHVCRILDDLAEEGCLWLLLTGGEPLVREDFRDIYLYAKKKGFLITLFTNGTLITPSLADFFEEFPPRSVEITLYGITERTYEQVTRSPGSYGRCRKGIDLLMERGLPLKLKTVILTVNRHEFLAIKEFVEGLGLEFRFDALINGRVNGRRNVAKLRIPPHEVVELDMTDPRRGPDFARLCERMSGVRQDPDLLFRCGAGVSSFQIDPYGRLMLCTIARNPSYDLRRGSFRKGWHDFLPRIREQKLKIRNKCADCDLRFICNQCPGWSQLEYGDQEMPLDYLCQVAHLRAEAYEIGTHHLAEW